MKGLERMSYRELLRALGLSGLGKRGLRDDWSGRHRGVVDAPSLSVFKKCLDNALNNVL